MHFVSPSLPPTPHQAPVIGLDLGSLLPSLFPSSSASSSSLLWGLFYFFFF